MSGKVFLLEDDEVISGLVKISLEMNGIECEVFPSVQTFTDALADVQPDVALLDIMLPDGSGLDVLVKTKKKYPKISYIMLSALGTEGDKIKGLELGADDYISKPFSVLELVARIKAALRRVSGDNILVVGGLELDKEKMRIKLNGTKLELNRKEFELLKYFMHNEGKVLSREFLLEKIWGYDGAETRTLDNHISRLRKLGIENIETVFGTGYRLKADSNEN